MKRNSCSDYFTKEQKKKNEINKKLISLFHSERIMVQQSFWLYDIVSLFVLLSQNKSLDWIFKHIFLNISLFHHNWSLDLPESYAY